MSGEVQVFVFGSAALVSVWALVWLFLVPGSKRDHKADAAGIKRFLVSFWGGLLGAILKGIGMLLSGELKDARRPQDGGGGEDAE